MARGGASVLALAGVLAFAAGCGGAEHDGTATAAVQRPAETAPSPAPACHQGVRPLGGSEAAYAATVVRTTTARRVPGGAPVTRFQPINVNDVPTVLGVLAVQRDRSCAPAWYRVQLPVRPNGSIGVDLSDRRVTLYRDGERVLSMTAAIGKPGTPTPTGRYYVNQRLLAADPSGPFGPGAVGISAFSPTLQYWAQGGPIAIHGTNTPYKLGLAVSYGCVRIANSHLLRLYGEADEGTPVVIRS
jgi:lipoprotein-anchoring transpeptidase ErfK/SrfK